MRIDVINGPNLNLLGTREPEIYGAQTLDDIEAMLTKTAKARGAGLRMRQSNHEGALVGYIQEARDAAALLINPAAYGHTSIALLDALRAVAAPKIEVHLSNIFTRESFRTHSYVSAGVDGVICGFGAISYALALDAAFALIDKRTS